jgi:hypothetical protein
VLSPPPYKYSVPINKAGAASGHIKPVALDGPGDTDVDNELSSDEDDLDSGLDMRVRNHTGAHRKEGICVVCLAYIHLKGGFGNFQGRTPSSKKRNLPSVTQAAKRFLRFSACKVQSASCYSCLGR